MNSDWPVWDLVFFCIINSASFLQADAACELEKQQVSQCNSELEAYQTEATRAIKSIFREQQPCSTHREEKLQKETKAKLDRMDRSLIKLIEALWKPGNQQGYASMGQLVVTANMDAPLQLSCGSEGKPLSLCVWQRNDPSGPIVIDRQVEADDGGRVSKRISTSGRGLSAGHCTIEIRAATADDLGEWRCSLVTDDGQVLIGELDVIDADAGEVKAISAKTSQVTTIIRQGTEAFYGIAVDTIRNKLYWSSSNKIYRSGLDGTGVQKVLDTSEYGTLWGLAFDWITGNLYVASEGGFISVCDGAPTRGFPRATILTGQGELRGIALNPSDRTLFFTTLRGTIIKAAMDGLNPTTIVSESGELGGITVDIHSSRLYWVNFRFDKIQSSRLDGSKIETLVESSDLCHGLALVQQRLYWGFYSEKRVESREIEGGDTSSIYYEVAGRIMYFASPDWSLAVNQTNPCEGQTCSGVCVLTRTNWRCVV